MLAVVVVPRYVTVFSPNGFIAGAYERMYSTYKHNRINFKVGCKRSLKATLKVIHLNITQYNNTNVPHINLWYLLSFHWVLRVDPMLLLQQFLFLVVV